MEQTQLQQSSKNKLEYKKKIYSCHFLTIISFIIKIPFISFIGHVEITFYHIMMSEDIIYFGSFNNTMDTQQTIKNKVNEIIKY